ncbi:MAG: sugar phosphate isomerase/epimerase [Bryobacteraceae bacterium]|nr:sugar phosphate isomerase/epimerase [Bryobacteraceae bacterium]
MSYRFRQSICNEVFEGWEFANTCAAIQRAGYTGIEIAPFTLADTPAEITPARRRELKATMAAHGLEFVGLHWLMVSPKGLHVTTPDEALYQRSWAHIGGLIDLCADLGDGGVMVFGSPFQRNSTGGLTPEQATRRFVEGLRGVAGQAASRGVKILVEALPKAQSDIVNTVAAAAAIVDEIGSPAIQTMFDTHNAADETEAHAAVLEKFYDRIFHVHVNEMDGGYCGSADYDFRPVLEVLKRREFAGWVSLEAFDFKPGAEFIADRSLRHLESLIAQLS